MTTANKITLVRIFMIPVFMVLMYLTDTVSIYIAMGVFILASLTDGLDGYVARHYNQVSTFGKFADPLADKLLVTAALLMFVQRGQMEAWVAMVILTREFAVTGLRLIAVGEGRVIAAAMSGKVKTFTTIVALCVMMTGIADNVLFASVTVNNICSWYIALITVYSGAEYFVKNRDILSFKA